MTCYTVRPDCRLCGAALPLLPTLSLTPTPPANEFVRAEDVGNPQDTFPLDVFVCNECAHAQLSVVVDPNRLFSNYVYVAGTSPVFVDHFRAYAEKMVSYFNLKPNDLVVDIGSNDGTLLRFFQEKGMRVLGVDPAVNIAKTATESGIPTIPEFFSLDVAKRIQAFHGRPALVVANNVFAHADDLSGIADSVQHLIRGGGAFVFEVSYLVDVCEKTLFDTIYHEHVANHSVYPLQKFFSSHHMKLIDIERISPQGGSIRGYVVVDNSLKTVNESVSDIIEMERQKGFLPDSHGAPLVALGQKIDQLRTSLVARLSELKSQGKSIAAYGAPAKATTLMYHFNLDNSIIDFVVDDNPLKQNLYTPGKHIPVLPSSALAEKNPDYLLVLAWNFADSIIEKNYAYRERGGKFIVPIPELREV